MTISGNRAARIAPLKRPPRFPSDVQARSGFCWNARSRVNWRKQLLYMTFGGTSTPK